MSNKKKITKLRKRKTISACMMVKDAVFMTSEAQFRGCLESVARLVDEIIVVDTGSTDTTMDICREFGARIYEHPWEKNFSLHRNQTLDYATGEWCFVVDSDETVLVPAALTRDEFKKQLSSIPLQLNAVVVDFKDIKKGSQSVTCTQPRIFRKGKCHYEHGIHNQPIFEGSVAQMLHVCIRHHGFDLAPDKMALKHQRTTELLLLELDRNPDRVETYFYLAQKCGEMGRSHDVIAWGEAFIASRAQAKHFDASIYWSVGRSHLKLGHYERVREIVEQAVKENPLDVDAWFLMADLGVAIHDSNLVHRGCTRFIDAMGEFKKNPHKRGPRMYFTLKLEVYEECLFRLYTQSLAQGLEAWKQVRDFAWGGDDEMQVSLRRKSMEHLNQIGMSSLLPEEPLPDFAAIMAEKMSESHTYNH